MARSIKQLGWAKDGVDGGEQAVVQDMLYIAVVSRPAVSLIISQEWVEDGVDDVESEAIRWMRNMGDADIVSLVIGLDWVRDGIDHSEVQAIEDISYIGNESVELASALLALSWVRDGIKGLEDRLIDDVSAIASGDSDAALRIVKMPFLEVADPADSGAMASLRQLLSFDPRVFRDILTHWRLDPGITDDLTTLVSTLGGVAKTNPTLFNILLDPNDVTVERRVVDLPWTGEMDLAIIRTVEGADRSMDLLEHAVREVERYMATPLPTRYIGLLFEDAVAASTSGTNFGTHIAILPKFDVDDDSQEAVKAGRIIAHEVAHYYWSDNADWIDEGLADFIASRVEADGTSSEVEVTNPPCAYARNILELENLIANGGDEGFECNYSLGDRFFVDLYRTLDESDFRAGALDLYIASTVEDNADFFWGTAVGIEELRESFVARDEAAEGSIARWFDGSEPYDQSISGVDSSRPRRRLPDIDSRVDEAYVSIGSSGPAVSSFTVDDLTGLAYFVLEYSYDVSAARYEIPLKIVEYYEDGFIYRRRSDVLTVSSNYVGGHLWFTVGPGPGKRWAPGRYGVYAYAADQKIADVKFRVTEE